MSHEFKARLRFKKTLWLGCVVEAIQLRHSKTSGSPYAVIRFKNCPFLLTWSPWVNRAWNIRVLGIAEFSPMVDSIRIRAGDSIHLDTKEMIHPGRTYETDKCYVNVRAVF